MSTEIPTDDVAVVETEEPKVPKVIEQKITRDTHITKCSSVIKYLVSKPCKVTIKEPLPAIPDISYEEELVTDSDEEGEYQIVEIIPTKWEKSKEAFYRLTIDAPCEISYRGIPIVSFNGTSVESSEVLPFKLEINVSGGAIGNVLSLVVTNGVTVSSNATKTTAGDNCNITLGPNACEISVDTGSNVSIPKTITSVTCGDSQITWEDPENTEFACSYDYTGKPRDYPVRVNALACDFVQTAVEIDGIPTITLPAIKQVTLRGNSSVLDQLKIVFNSAISVAHNELNNTFTHPVADLVEEECTNLNKFHNATLLDILSTKPPPTKAEKAAAASLIAAAEPKNIKFVNHKSLREYSGTGLRIEWLDKLIFGGKEGIIKLTKTNTATFLAAELVSDTDVDLCLEVDWLTSDLAKHAESVRHKSFDLGYKEPNNVTIITSDN